MRQRSLTIVVLVSALVSALVTAALTLRLDVPGRGGGPTRQAAAQVPAAVPELVNFQGVLTDGSGNPLSQGLYTVTFRVFDVATGGTALWTEIQDVKVDDGLFHVLLGSVTALTADVFNGTPRYLEVKVGTDPAMTPRQQFTSVPYAFHAGTTESGVPSGTIILWDGGACPTGYTRLASYDDKFLVASGTAGTTGGSATHTHGAGSYAAPSHTHPAGNHYHQIGASDGGAPSQITNDEGGRQRTLGAVGTTGSGGGGAITGTSASGDNTPPFKTILLCKKD